MQYSPKSSEYMGEYMRRYFLTFLFSVFLLSGCGDGGSVEDWANQDDVSFVKESFGLIVKGSYADFEKRSLPELRGMLTEENFKKFSDYVPRGDHKSSQVISFSTQFETGQPTQHSYTLLYAYPDDWVTFQISFAVPDNERLISKFFIGKMTAAQVKANEFTLKGKGLSQIVFLCLMVVIPVFMIAMFVRCIMSPLELKAKILWCVFILIGFVRLKMNWTDGSLWIDPLSFALLGAGFTKQMVIAPWMMAISLPVGAIMFAYRYGLWPKTTELDDAGAEGA